MRKQIITAENWKAFWREMEKSVKNVNVEEEEKETEGKNKTQQLKN